MTVRLVSSYNRLMTTTEDAIKSGLRRLEYASDRIRRAAAEIAGNMNDLVGSIDAGMTCRSQNHQLPFDLQTALADRQSAVEFLMTLDVDRDVIRKAAKGS